MPKMMPHGTTAAPPATRFTPLLDLLRTTVTQYGEVRFRVLPVDHLLAESGAVVPAEHLICLPAESCDAEWLVYALYQLSLADVDPRCEAVADRFADDAARRTLAAMGGAR